MNKYCNIVKDLMCLYTEGECSSETAAFIEEHLNECEECRALFEGIKKTDALVSETVNTEPDPSERIIKKGFKRIKKRLSLSGIAILLVIPVMLASILFVNEIKKDGICYSNLDEVALARKIGLYLENEQYEKAAKLLDFSYDYDNLISAQNMFDQNYYDTAVVTDKDKYIYSVDYQWALYFGIDMNGIWSEPYDETEFWTYIIFELGSEIFIPEEIWNKLVTEQAHDTYNGKPIVYPMIINGNQFGKNEWFFKYETEFGNYYSSLEVVSQEITAPMIVNMSAIINKEVYDSAREDIERVTREEYENFLEFYEEELKMTKEEYIDYRKNDFVSRMETYSSRGYKLDYKKIKDVYFYDGCWHIEISFIENGSYLSLHFKVKDGLAVKSGSQGNSYLTNEVLGKVRFP